MATTKAISVIAILACVSNNCGIPCLVDAKISNWSTPSITTSNGNGTLTLPENTPIGPTTLTLVAVSSVTGPITYTIDSPSDVFTMESNGTISLKSELDFETKPKFTIAVTADDKNGTGKASVTISVSDIEPEFSKASYQGCVVDGALTNTSVTSVKAGGDKSTGVTYTIKAGNDNGFFKINEKGEITVAKKIEKSKKQSYILTVGSAKTGASGDTAEVKVKLGPCSSASLNTQLNIFTILVAVMTHF